MKIQNRRPRPNPTADPQSCGFAELIQLTILALAFVLAASGCTTTTSRDDAGAGPHPFRNNGAYAGAGDVPRQRPAHYQSRPQPAATTNATIRTTNGTGTPTDDAAKPVSSAPVVISTEDAAVDGTNGATGESSTDESPAGSLLSEPDEEVAGPMAPNPAVASGPGVFDPGNEKPQADEAVAVSTVKPARDLALVQLSQKPSSRHIIIIDPGHGGRDPGGSGHGLVEKELALDVSNRLVPMLRRAGFTVKMTRTGDTYPSLPDRINFCKRHRGWMFLSIHANAFTKPESRGVETLFPSRGRQVRNSRSFAALIQKELADLCPTVNRGAKADQRNLYLMRNAPCTLALAEMGFMTNEEDAKYLSEEAWRESIAHALYNGIIRYYNANR